MKIVFHGTFGTLLAFVLISCDPPTEQKSAGEVSKQEVKVPVFQADSAFSFIAKQVAMSIKGKLALSPYPER